MTARQILIAEDTALMRDSMREILTRIGFSCEAAASGTEALEKFQRGEFSVLVTDLRMPGMTGIELLEAVLKLDPKICVIVVTAYGTVQTAVDAMKKGAFDYLVKPFGAPELEVVVEKACARYRLTQENENLREELSRQNAFEWIGSSPVVRRIQEEVRRIAASTSTVLVRGESGTGKEVAARAIHAWGSRREKPLICVNCAALSAGLLESELFGHEKGAFTGADRARQGRFELADGGTILLDEVSEIDLNLQAKLLRVLQERSFERVGSSVTRTVDVRVIATSNRSLEEAVAAGKFRGDLFYRLNVVPIYLPPLREHREDVPELTAHFLRGVARRGGKAFRSVDPKAMKKLSEYAWPGNVRELANVIERVCLLWDGEVLQEAGLSFLSEGGAREGAGPASFAVAGAGVTLAEVERRVILATLAAHAGQRRKTAEALGISERTLREKLREWKMEKDAAPMENSAAEAGSP